MMSLQPYQIFFPLGLFYGLWGAWVWPAFSFGGQAYPGVLHSSLMTGGFLLCFATGFLLTAVPRFTGTDAAGKEEVGTALALSLWPLLTAIFAPSFSLAGTFILLGFLLWFFLGRRWRAGFDVPPFFDLIALGLVSGMVGSSMLFLIQQGKLSSEYGQGAKVLLHQMLMLTLVLGIGSRLVAALLGWAEPGRVQITRMDGCPLRKSLSLSAVRIVGALLVISAATDMVAWNGVGSIFRAVAATWIAFALWKLHRRPRQKGRLALWLWISGWGLLLGLWVNAAVPAFGIHGLHVVYVVGFSWMVIVIASRVTLAHGGHDLAIELKSRSLQIAGFLILLAAVTRVSAPLLPQSYFHHLGYAALTWILAVLVWAWGFVPRMFPRWTAQKGERA